MMANRGREQDYQEKEKKEGEKEKGGEVMLARCEEKETENKIVGKTREKKYEVGK